MSRSERDALVKRYLRQLRRAARRMPRRRRKELVDEIAEHLRETVPVDADAAVTRAALERLGPPGAIVGAEVGARGPRPPSRTAERFAIVLLLLGGLIVPVVGWLAGVVLLWTSSVWTTRDKLIGTFIVPGGWSALYLGFVLTVEGRSCHGGGTPRHHLMVCTPGPSLPAEIARGAVLALCLLGPLFTAVYLSRRLRQRDRFAAA